MFRVVLVNAPFTTVRLPSLALTQLKARLRDRLAGRVEVEIAYLNHDFAAWVGVETYETIATDTDVYHTGFGDWLFRQIAFPETADNRDEYLRRYYRRADRKQEAVAPALARRDELSAFVDAMIARYRLDEAALVGFSAVFAQTVPSIAIARRIKERSPRVITAVGGACCEAEMGQELARQIPWFDYVFSGEALVSFPSVVESLVEGRRDEHSIAGVFTRRRVALPIANAPSPLVGEPLSIDEVVHPDYDDFLASYRDKVDAGGRRPPALLFETSRGCWWGEIQHCTFCGLNGSTMAHREMSAPKALEMLSRLFQRYPEIAFYQAVDNILPLRYLREVLPNVRAPRDVVLYYEVKSNMDDDDVRAVAAGHVRALQPGIESISTASLKRMQKGVNAFQNIRFLASCRMHGVAPKWNFIIGFPGEPESIYEKYVRDIPLLSHLPPPTDVSTVRFDRFSPYHARAAEHGLDLVPFEFYRLIYPFDDVALRNIAYHFVHRDPAYYVPIARWQRRLQPLVDAWQARRTGADGQVAADLFRDGAAIYDTRSGTVVVHELEPGVADLLDELRTPRTLDRVGARGRELSWLRERGLVFEEDGRVMSLVFPRKPEPPSWDRERLRDYGIPPYLLTP
jgi:magnesium-protoporphyrin IX monomethyl ester (oxidative) cyclase